MLLHPTVKDGAKELPKGQFRLKVMDKRKKTIIKKKQKEEEAVEFDYSEGFGGFPDDVDLTKNIGCASNSKKKKK